VCVFCAEKVEPEYKSVNRLRRFLSDRSRIESGRKTGTCSRHQRLVRREIKRARFLALLPFTSDHVRVTGVAAQPGARAAEDGEVSAGAEGAVETGDQEPGDAAPDESGAEAGDVEGSEETGGER
jgi:small subunit ribosomal protein S18